MNWIERLQNALNYIESNLDKDLSVESISSQAFTTAFHFQRMFSAITGITLAEYIRKRRLTLAAQELVSGKASIVDTALKFGYASQASFTRAFRQFHGVPPGVLGNGGTVVRSFLPVAFQISISGEVTMEYEIRETGPIQVVGEVRKFTNKDGQNQRDIPAFWKEFESKGLFEPLFKLTDGQPITGKVILGICMSFSDSQEEFEYMIAVESGRKEYPEPFRMRTIPASCWAIFRAESAKVESIHKLWKRIYSEWFPSTKYVHAGSAEMELYPDEDSMEIWVPIKKE